MRRAPQGAPEVTYRYRPTGQELTRHIWLDGEVELSSMSDYYTPEEASASELMWLWLRQIDSSRYERECVPIYWSVKGDEYKSERAPFHNEVSEDFLTFFTWPTTQDGSPLRWASLPVADRLWRPGQADKGGFIQELTGWKPSPFQESVNVDLLLTTTAIGYEVSA